MAHIEFKFVPLALFPADSGVQIISLDCWRATIVFKGATGPTMILDNVPFNFLLAEDANDVNASQRVVIGGAYLNGVPINIKHDLEFSMPPGATAYAVLVLEYFVK